MNLDSKITFSSGLMFEYLKIIFIVLFYWTISIFMVFINKYVFSNEDFHFDAPFFITFFQCICSIVTTLIISLIDNFFELPFLRLIDFPHMSIYKLLNFHIINKTFSLSLIFVLMIVCNNLCLKYVDVAFYFVSRSLTTVFNVLFVFLILHQKTSLEVILSCIVIISGFLLGVDQEKITGNFNFFGIFFGLLSSIFVSLNSIYAKKLLQKVDNNVWLINLYNNFNSIFIFIPLIIISGELNVLFKYKNYSLHFLIVMIVSGLLGFLIQFSSLLQIKLTSPLTHNVSGTVKSCLQTVIAVIFYNQMKSFLWWFSNCLVIVGSLIYTRLKQIEMKQNFLDQQQSKETEDKTTLISNVKTC